MTLDNTRFGTVEYSDIDVVTFDFGLIGFPACTQFLVICAKENSPFRWLQSIEEPALAFLVTDPRNYVDDYSPKISKDDSRFLALENEEERLVFTTVNIPKGKPEEMTLNLAGPLVINADTRKGKQIVLEDEAYTTKYRVFQQTAKVTDSVAA